MEFNQDTPQKAARNNVTETPRSKHSPLSFKENNTPRLDTYINMASAHDLSAWDKDGRVFLFTSLTAGSSHIVTATSRIETILNANRIPFMAIDTATNESAKRLWGRRSGGKKFPVLVKEGYVIAVRWSPVFCELQCPNAIPYRTSKKSKNGTSLARSKRTSATCPPSVPPLRQVVRQ
jgi:hypothetical protein